MDAHTHGKGLEILEELARRFRAGELESAFALYHPCIRIEQPASLPHGGVHQGLPAVREMGTLFAQYWARAISGPLRTSCADGRVLQITTQTWTSKATGRTASMDVVELISFADDLVVEIRVFQHDTHRLLETLEP